MQGLEQEDGPVAALFLKEGQSSGYTPNSTWEPLPTAISKANWALDFPKEDPAKERKPLRLHRGQETFSRIPSRPGSAQKDTGFTRGKEGTACRQIANAEHL